MSLINDMLRNLEAKRPDDLARQNLQREIRSLPADSSRQGLRLKAGLLAGVALLGLKVGTRFHWETRAGESRKLTVLAVTRPAAEAVTAQASAPTPATR